MRAEDEKERFAVECERLQLQCEQMKSTQARSVCVGVCGCGGGAYVWKEWVSGFGESGRVWEECVCGVCSSGNHCWLAWQHCLFRNNYLGCYMYYCVCRLLHVLLCVQVGGGTL